MYKFKFKSDNALYEEILEVTTMAFETSIISEKSIPGIFSDQTEQKFVARSISNIWQN
jgi:hypothetical protein